MSRPPGIDRSRQVMRHSERQACAVPPRRPVPGFGALFRRPGSEGPCPRAFLRV
jgi:hypothetical protein